MKKYRLLKDLPGVKAGTIYEYRSTGQCTTDAFYFTENSGQFASMINCNCFMSSILEDKDWFEEIKDQEKEFTREDMIDFALSMKLQANCNRNTYISEFTMEDHLHYWLKNRNK